MDGSNLQESEQDRGTLQARGVNLDSGGLLTRKGSIPRYVSKRSKRQERAVARALAELKAENDNADGDSFGLIEYFVLF